MEVQAISGLGKTGVVGCALLVLSLGGIAFGVLTLVFSGQSCEDWKRTTVPVSEFPLHLEEGSYDISLEFSGYRVRTDEVLSLVTVALTDSTGHAVQVRENRWGIYRTCRSGAWGWSFDIPADADYRLTLQTSSPPGEPVIAAVSRDMTRRELLTGLIPLIVFGLLHFLSYALFIVAASRARRRRL